MIINLNKWYFRIVGLLDLLFIDAELLLMLTPELDQGVGQLALEFLLPAAVDLDHAGLVSAFRLAQFLRRK